MSEYSKRSKYDTVSSSESSQSEWEEDNDPDPVTLRNLRPSNTPLLLSMKELHYGFAPEWEKASPIPETLRVSFNSRKCPTNNAATEQQRPLNSLLLRSVLFFQNKQVKSLLQEGGDPNATCHYCNISACHVAVTKDNKEALQLLLKYNADKNKQDTFGRTPLHLAAWAGNDSVIARILDFPIDLPCEDLKELPDAEEKIKDLRLQMGSIINDPCQPILPIIWIANNEHDCEGINRFMPEFSSGWTPLHVASYAAHHNTTRLLLAAGANPNSKDAWEQTPLDVAGAAYFLKLRDINVNSYVATITTLIEYGGELNTAKHTFGSYSALETAVELCSIEAVRCLLAAGAPVTHKILRGTAVDLAASKGKVDILNEILSVTSVADPTYHESSMHLAIRCGDLNFVQKLVSAGAPLCIKKYDEPINYDIQKFKKHCGLYSADTMIDGQRNFASELNMIVHATAAEGNLEILKFLLDHDRNLLQLMDRRSHNLRLTPMELAALYKKIDIFKFLLIRLFWNQNLWYQWNPSIFFKIAVYFKHDDIFNEVLQRLPNISMTNKKEHCPLIHVAIKYGNKNMLMQLIKHGADLALRDERGRTALGLLMKHYPKPTELIMKVFDQHLDFFCDASNPTIKVDYSVLVPQRQECLTDEGEMRVLRALLKTGDKKGQRKLLTHPLVESFLFLKWKTLLLIFYIVVFFYSLYILSLSVSIVSVFYHKDKNSSVPDIIWQYIMLFSLCIVVTQEFLCTNLSTKTWISKILTIEFWLKLGSFCFAVTTPFIVTVESEHTEWRRVLATLTLVLAWMNMILLLSKIPISGSYIQMFWMVFTKIIEILLTFLFLIIMFSFCFMIQNPNEESFDPLAALVKTFVMLTSELDYENAIRMNKDKNISISIIMLQNIFFILLILTAIVMMNLMTSVAVNDVQELILAGNLRKLEAQLEFLNSLMNLKERFGLYRFFNWKIVPRMVKIKLLENKKYYYNEYIRKAILIKAQELSNKKKKEEEENKYHSKLDKIIQAVFKNEENITTMESKLEKILKFVTKNSPETFELGSE